MSHARPDPASEPIRTAESEVAAYQWDGWHASAAAAFVRSRRRALAVSVVIGIVVGTAGLVWLPGDAKVSVALYAPVGAWAAWSAAYRWPAGRSLRAAVDGVRSLVVPALLDTVDASALVSLLRHGGALVTARSTVIVAERRDSLVVLVASQYDVSHEPLNIPAGYAGP